MCTLRSDMLRALYAESRQKPNEGELVCQFAFSFARFQNHLLVKFRCCAVTLCFALQTCEQTQSAFNALCNV